MTGVILKSNEPFERALRRFSKSCEKSGVLSNIKKNRFFEKPSEKKKRIMNTAKRKAMKERLIEEGVITLRAPKSKRRG